MAASLILHLCSPLTYNQQIVYVQRVDHVAPQQSEPEDALKPLFVSLVYVSLMQV